MMQLLRTELDNANRLRAEATDSRAQAALDGVIFALQWAIEDGANAAPADRASRLRVEPKHAPKGNADDALVAGNVAEIAGSIDDKTDLDALEAAEKDREVPRSGVLNAIAKERAARAKAE